MLSNEVDGYSPCARWTINLALNREGIPLESITFAYFPGTFGELCRKTNLHSTDMNVGQKSGQRGLPLHKI